jgi:hypothetical protein
VIGNSEEMGSYPNFAKWGANKGGCWRSQQNNPISAGFLFTAMRVFAVLGLGISMRA